MECQRLGVLKRGKPTSGRPTSLTARERLRALESRSASICTVVAGTCSPCPLKAASSSYLLGNVPSCSYCALTVSSIPLYMVRDSARQAMSLRDCSFFTNKRYSNVLIRTFYCKFLEMSPVLRLGAAFHPHAYMQGPSRRVLVGTILHLDQVRVEYRKIVQEFVAEKKGAWHSLAH